MTMYAPEPPLPEPTEENLHELEREIRVYLEAYALVRAYRSARLRERILAYAIR